MRGSSVFGKWAVRLAAVWIVALCVACGSGEGSKKESSQKDSAGGSTTVKIGAVLPLSGPLAAYGQRTLDGMKLMVEKVNAAGGVNGKTLELEIENDENDTTKASNAVLKLIGLKKTLAIVGPIISTVCLAVGRDCEKKQVVMITPTATNDTVTAQGDYVFRACFNDSFQGVAMAKFAVEELKLKSVVAFQDTTSDYSVGLCKRFSETFTQLGGQSLPLLSYKQGDTEFTAQLRKAREAGAETIFIPGYPPELPLIINEARSLGLTIPLLGADGWDNDDVIKNAGQNLVNSYFAAAFSREMGAPALDEFLKLATAKGIENPGSFEALGYDSVGLVVAAIQASGAGFDALPLDQQRQAIQKGLTGLKDYPGATGSITMQASGDPLKSLVIQKFDPKAGQVDKVFVKTIQP
jgi:branched-chain amino acid transport system substrate-binding protein